MTILTPFDDAVRLELRCFETAVCPSFIRDFFPALFPLLSLRFFASAAIFAFAVVNMPANALGRPEEDEEAGGCRWLFDMVKMNLYYPLS